jgi:hypothetical protein
MMPMQVGLPAAASRNWSSIFSGCQEENCSIS